MTPKPSNPEIAAILLKEKEEIVVEKSMSSLMGKMLYKLDRVPGPQGKPFSEPANIKHPYYNVLDDITDYTKKINF